MDYEMEELLPVVKELSEQYTGRESSSVSYETANRLMGAVLYCMKENEEPSNALKSSRRVPPREYYRSGYELLIRKVLRAKKAYEELAADFNCYGNRAFYETVLEGIPAFFLRYDPRFDPADTIITMDYPVLKNLEGSRGADAVSDYLDCIRLEQIFLGKFEENAVKDILLSSHGGYEELFINLCGAVLRNVLACMALGKSVATPFDPEDYERLQLLVTGFQREELERLLTKLLNKFIEAVFPETPELFSYLKKELPDFSAELMNAASHGTLHGLL